ncbi:MAG: HAD hydrolase-like protein [Oscillospiraceae bacterium]|nr:HAD hydrolase-like protein [Oscillospiraceae bacterium]
MRFDTILFDLDGTLTDSAPGITGSVRYALTTMGKPVPDDLTCFVGPPLKYSFMTFTGMDEDEAQMAIQHYVSRYIDEGGMFENSVYDGIIDMLARLKAAGIRSVIATSKHEPIAVRIADRFGLSPYLDGVYGSDRDAGRTEKADVIRYALDGMGITDSSRPLMVGDRDYDSKGAHDVGIACMGILWGYGSREEFAACGTEYIVSTPNEAADLILDRALRVKS